MKIIETSSFFQGYANASNTSEYAVKTPVLSMIPTNKVTVSFEKTTEKNIRFALVGYSNPKPENLICELKWYTDNPKTFDISKYINAKYWVAVFQNSDGSKISPSDMASVTVTIENLWYIDGNGDLRCQNMPYAPPSPLASPYPSAMWRVSEDVLKHEIYPEAPEKPVSKPYPKALWRIDYLSPNMPYHALFPVEKPAGAFMNAKNLEYARIPETVRKIGRFAFAETALSKVRISPECEFYETSFPENCVIEFYGEQHEENSGQLYDSDGNTLIDADGARIYTQEVLYG